MKRLSVVLLLVLLAGCGKAVAIKGTTDAALAVSIATYCRMPYGVRMANREYVGNILKPNEIAIVCAVDAAK